MWEQSAQPFEFSDYSQPVRLKTVIGHVVRDNRVFITILTLGLSLFALAAIATGGAQQALIQRWAALGVSVAFVVFVLAFMVAVEFRERQFKSRAADNDTLARLYRRLEYCELVDQARRAHHKIDDVWRNGHVEQARQGITRSMVAEVGASRASQA